jgi:hypothetical protein
MNYLCKSCGGDEPVQDGVPCSACGRRHFILKVEPGEMKITGFPIGMIVEGDPNNPLAASKTAPRQVVHQTRLLPPTAAFKLHSQAHLTAAALASLMSSRFSSTNFASVNQKFTSMIVLVMISERMEFWS